MIGFFASLALRYPGVAKFMKRFGKWVALAAAVAGLAWGVHHWFEGVKLDSYNQGFRTAGEQYQRQVEQANARAQQNERIMLQFADKLGASTGHAVEQLTVKIDPIQRDIQNEVSQNPVYRDCRLTDGVRRSLDVERAAVNAGIAASNPARD